MEEQLLDHEGAELGTSDRMLVDQARINGFADDTDDRQWIHVDAERAKSGPFGTTIAHGYLTLSLAPAMLAQVVDVGNVQAAVNYGLNKVRFPAPVPVDSRVRGSAALRSVTPRGTRSRRCSR
jgi:acyl dehydratase